MTRIHLIGFGLLIGLLAASARSLDLVVDGQPKAVIVIEKAAEPAAPAKGKGRPAKGVVRKRAELGDPMAAEVLQEWVKKITGAELPIADKAGEGQVAIYVGKSAISAGLKVDDIDSPTHEGVRIVCDGKRVLIAGQDPTSTVKAACRFLEELGCRFFMDHPMGEVYPSAKTLSVKDLNITEKPGLVLRQIWGSNWGGNGLWKIWNGAGGQQYAMGHAWGGYVDHNLFDAHPEYFALRNGERKKGDWYCTSNPELRRIFAEGVITRLDAQGGASPSASISPPDGVAYCECDKCKAQDDPNSIEPSSGRVCVTDRYVDFFNDVAKRVREKHPDARLSFYCYADYTQAPTRGVKLDPMLIAWIAPLRYCRIHAIDSPICPSRQQLAQMIDGWAKATDHIAYRTYNYHLAECSVPFSMLSTWGHDIPYLKARGAVGINNETLISWNIYGPHLYASLRLMYDPSADVAKLAEDYCIRFYGSKAGPRMLECWRAIDRAWSEAPAHAGSFFAVHRVYTPEFIVKCRSLVDAAVAATKDDPTYGPRVAMTSEGLRNAEQYTQLRDLLNSGKPQEAAAVYRDLVKRAEGQQAARYANAYTPGYIKRFLGKCVEGAAAAAATPNKVIATLPDQMRLAYDEADKGVEAGYAKPEFDDSAWKTVRTFGDTLNGQGLPDKQTIMWYRTTIDLPAAPAKSSSLYFVEVDGLATVYVNGKEAGVSGKKRVPFEVEGKDLKAGRNVIAVRVDHSGITELMLGGIVRPVYVVEKGK